jgi:hypothetical protein
MPCSIPAGQSGCAGAVRTTVAAASAVALLPGFLLASCTLPPEVQSAWNRYIKAEEAYEGCKSAATSAMRRRMGCLQRGSQ